MSAQSLAMASRTGRRTNVAKFPQLEVVGTCANAIEATQRLFVRADRKEVKITFADLLYARGLKDYVGFRGPMSSGRDGARILSQGYEGAPTRGAEAVTLHGDHRATWLALEFELECETRDARHVGLHEKKTASLRAFGRGLKAPCSGAAQVTAQSPHHHEAKGSGAEQLLGSIEGSVRLGADHEQALEGHAGLGEGWRIEGARGVDPGHGSTFIRFSSEDAGGEVGSTRAGGAPQDRERALGESATFSVSAQEAVQRGYPGRSAGLRAQKGRVLAEIAPKRVEIVDRRLGHTPKVLNKRHVVYSLVQCFRLASSFTSRVRLCMALPWVFSAASSGFRT